MSVARPALEYIDKIKVQLDMKRSTRALKRMAKYGKPYLGWIVLIALLSVFRSRLFTLEPLYTSEIIDTVVINKDYDLLRGLLIKIFLAVTGFGLSNFAVVFINGYIAKRMIRDIRSDYYASLQEKSFDFHDSSAVGDLISRATMDLQPVDMFLAQGVGTLCDAVFTSITASAVMFSVNRKMSLLAIFLILLTFYFNVGLFTKTMPIFRKMQLILGRISAYIQQNILGMKNVRIFCREDEMEEGFKTIEGRYINTALSAGRLQSIYTPAAEAALGLGVTIIYVYGTNLILAPEAILTIGNLLLFARYMRRMTNPLRNVSMVIGQWVNASAGFERVTDVIDAKVTVQDRDDAKDLEIARGEVEFKDVSFG